MTITATPSIVIAPTEIIKPSDIAGARSTEPDASTPSNDYKEMSHKWMLIDDILTGIEAIRAKGQLYLPQYETETLNEYKRRLACSPWRPLFEDCVQTLSSKPFSKDVTVSEGTVDDEYLSNIDLQGNSLTVFAREAFRSGIARGLHAIIVDYPTMQPNLTLADERESGARPYFVHVAASNILACYTKVEKDATGKVQERVVHIRIREDTVERVGEWAEEVVNRVRVLESVEGKNFWKLFRKDKETGRYVLEREGPITLPMLPVVLYFTGERSGNYAVKPPLIDLAHMQIEVYQALSRKEEILDFAGAPMLTANGMRAPEQAFDEDGRIKEEQSASVQVGPKRILFAPPGADGVPTSWSYVEPTAANIGEIRKDIEELTKEFRMLAMQPNVQGTGDVTATASGIDASRAHSACESWANGLRAALEQAFVFFNMWRKDTGVVKINVHTDFAVSLTGSSDIGQLQAMRTRGDLSRKTLWIESQRRGLLGPQFDAEKEKEFIAQDREETIDNMPSGDGSTLQGQQDDNDEDNTDDNNRGRRQPPFESRGRQEENDGQ